MRGHIYKDLYLIRNKTIYSIIMSVFTIIFGFVIYLLPRTVPDMDGIPMPSVSSLVLMLDILIIINASVLCNEVIKTDKERVWGYYGVALPGSEKSVVAAKYMTVFILYFITFLITELLGVIVGLFANELVNWSMPVLYIIMFGVLLRAVEMPLAFRFGADKANGIRILLTTVIVLIIGIYLGFGNIEWLMGENGILKNLIAAIEEDQNVIETAKNEISGILAKMTYWSIILSSLFPHVVVILYCISYRVSCKVYKKGVTRADV